MPKGNRGGRGGNSGQNAAGGGGGIGGSMSQSHTGVKMATSSAMRQQPIVQGYQQVNGQQVSQTIQQTGSYQDPDFVYARKMYISDAVDSAGFSMSQNLNYKLDNNLPLDVNETYMHNMLGLGMHDLGQNGQFLRASHDDILKKLGVQDYTKMTQAQLQQKLIGQTFTTTSYTSASYDSSKNPFLPGQPNGGGREVYSKINAASTTKVFFGARSQAETVFSPGTNGRITNVYFDGSYATPRSRSTSVPRVVLEYDVW